MSQHATCESFNAIDVRDLHRDNLLRPGLRFICKWGDELFDDIVIFTEPDAILLVYRVLPAGAAEWKSVEQRVPIIWTQCRFGAAGLGSNA
jgi:hypothetical protein